MEGNLRHQSMAALTARCKKPSTTATMTPSPPTRTCRGLREMLRTVLINQSSSIITSSPAPRTARLSSSLPASSGTSRAMSGSIRERPPRRRMFASRHPSTAPEARDCPTRRGASRPGACPAVGQSCPHRPVRHHLRAAQGATRERVLGPVALKCAKMAPLSYVCPESTTITGSRNTARVMGHKSTSGSASRSAEICVGGVGHVAPCARGTPGSHTLGRDPGCRMRRGGRLAPLGGRHRTNPIPNPGCAPARSKLAWTETLNGDAMPVLAIAILASYDTSKDPIQHTRAQWRCCSSTSILSPTAFHLDGGLVGYGFPASSAQSGRHCLLLTRVESNWIQCAAELKRTLVADSVPSQNQRVKAGVIS